MLRSGFVFLAMVAAAVPALAHHSFSATYYMDQLQKIEGTVFQFMFRNPHTMIQVEVQDVSGEKHLYSIEWGGAGALAQDQVTRTTLKPGDKVIIEGVPGRRAEDRKLLLRHIVRPADGWEWGGTVD